MLVNPVYWFSTKYFVINFSYVIISVNSDACGTNMVTKS